jgi:hypothetical protein
MFMAGSKGERHAATVNFLEALGITPTSEALTHLNVLVEALLIHDSRKIYGRVWQRYGWLSNLLSIARKADRLMQVFWFGSGSLDHKPSADDAYDLINYAVFFIRNVEADNARGVN